MFIYIYIYSLNNTVVYIYIYTVHLHIYIYIDKHVTAKAYCNNARKILITGDESEINNQISKSQSKVLNTSEGEPGSKEASNINDDCKEASEQYDIEYKELKIYDKLLASCWSNIMEIMGNFGSLKDDIIKGCDNNPNVDNGINVWEYIDTPKMKYIEFVISLLLDNIINLHPITSTIRTILTCATYWNFDVSYLSYHYVIMYTIAIFASVHQYVSEFLRDAQGTWLFDASEKNYHKSSLFMIKACSLGETRFVFVNASDCKKGVSAIFHEYLVNDVPLFDIVNQKGIVCIYIVSIFILIYSIYVYIYIYIIHTLIHTFICVLCTNI